MSCECFEACPIDQCTTTLNIGVADPETDYTVVIEDTITGRQRRIAVTTDEEGNISITPPAGFLSPNFKYKIYLLSGPNCEYITFYISGVATECVLFSAVATGNTDEVIFSNLNLVDQDIEILDEDGNPILDEDLNPILSE